MSNENNSWNDKDVMLQDIVLSNSWALQAILNYLDEENPGARDRIWKHYEALKQLAEVEAQKAASSETTTDSDDLDKPTDSEKVIN